MMAAAHCNGAPSSGEADVAAYTAACQSVSGSKASPRAKFVLDRLMVHLHQWAKEVDLTIDEWMLACDELVKSGKMSDDRRNEMILISDVLGLESLLDTMAHERAEKAATEQASTGSTVVASTDSAILGPFYREGAPRYEHGGDIVLDHSIKAKDGTPGRTCFLHGRVTDVAGKTIAGAHIDVWHTAANGYYEQQDPSQPEYNNRGAFTSDADGKYALRCLVPTAYPIPYDGGAGSILRALDRSPMRPAHIHFFVKAPGHKSLVTQIFDRECKYLSSDAVFATKDSLVVDFKKPAPGVETDTELPYDIVLVPETE